MMQRIMYRFCIEMHATIHKVYKKSATPPKPKHKQTNTHTFTGFFICESEKPTVPLPATIIYEMHELVIYCLRAYMQFRNNNVIWISVNHISVGTSAIQTKSTTDGRISTNVKHTHTESYSPHINQQINYFRSFLWLNLRMKKNKTK